MTCFNADYAFNWAQSCGDDGQVCLGASCKEVNISAVGLSAEMAFDFGFCSVTPLIESVASEVLIIDFRQCLQDFRMGTVIIVIVPT
jgi:hypothetical protein